MAVNALLTRTGLDPAMANEVIFGCVSQPADAANVARVIALRAGIPERVPAMTVHRNCASGCEALRKAAEKISAGRGSIFIVGGTESMRCRCFLSNALRKNLDGLLVPKTFGRVARSPFRPSDFQPRIVYSWPPIPFAG